MNIFNQTISVSIGFAILGALGLGGYMAIDYIGTLFLSMDILVAKVTAIASVVVLLAATLISSSIRQASKHIRSNQIRGDKTATYKLFVETWSMLLRDRTGLPLVMSEAPQMLDQQLALYGSPSVIKSYLSLRALAADAGANDVAISTQFSEALLEVRKDIGSDSSDLAPEELGRLLRTNQEVNQGGGAMGTV